jgi:hypothetical protein
MSLDVSRLALTAGAAGIMIALGIGVRAMLPGHVDLGRRVYWTGWTLGVPLFLAGTWGQPLKTLEMAVLFGCMAIGCAYLVTPYLRIRGHVYALPSTRRRYATPPPTRAASTQRSGRGGRTGTGVS